MFLNPGIPSKEMDQYHGKRLPRCIHCKQYKPYRTHHCSSCKCCYAKLDHHCNALGRCIALRNHKPFLVFLIHSVSMLVIWFLTVCYMLLAIKYDDSPRFLHFHFYASISLTILITFLLYEQISNVLTGKTTLEIIYNIPIEIKKTKLECFEEVMGPFNIGWLIPTETPSSTSAFQWEDLRPPSEQIPQPTADEKNAESATNSTSEGNSKTEGKIERK
ncbi:DHHC zinc finger domain containing protein [Trichomonas vaginalis G3]|uniref:Palmitoyltransferase n=1 Tax=Trichomonas vaginalis (strain ATCC PRA-98 / G3) TaxID=412133 RepID=A2DTG6_TRIV3|nr:cysteine S-palmitoyltransferase protein [Trichomonas vaginalis G3]EAY16275.1 DHHC zinc finger domain containing protein [Trichomonas vaginalis G3]KAI5523425.1 cysteine S-palmitoyltransferase protein [Trichomonas vaginalis G3]|eukprot:XP_001328498.1 DHHC zinc finger domain containing protein [Trichomonas vaginalis G3]